MNRKKMFLLLSLVCGFCLSFNIQAANWFVKSDASGGNGQSWDGAFNVSELMSALNKDLIASGDNVYFAGGSYYFGQNDSIKVSKGISFYGGYPTDLTGTQTPKITYPSENPTNFIGYAKDWNRGLYNGIVLPAIWPPMNIDINSYDPMPVPYLNDIPAVIPINVGRQLFFDDFLIEKNEGLDRIFYNARKIDANPILKAQTKIEKSSIPGAMPKDGGVWWDPDKEQFNMWYEAGWLNDMAFATSKDGVTWDRPSLGIGLMNQILPNLVPNSCSVIMDYDAPDEQRYKMFLRPPNANSISNTGYCMVSGDGINWTDYVATGPCGDRSTMFYNPFRKKYVFSIRSLDVLGDSPYGRARYYYETSDFLKGATWSKTSPVFWCNADNLDIPDPDLQIPAELYNLDAVGYESIMLGLHQIFLGPQNDECLAKGIPKITELKVSFSRDGFHWERPNRDAFISASRTANSWDRGYVQSVGGICTVVGDQLRFYYIGFKGDQSAAGQSYGMHSNGATGIAVLRRDGFCSMSSKNSGTLTTRTIVFEGKHLFVNVDCPSGEFLAELTDADGNTVDGYSFDDCVPVSVNSTIQEVKWKSGKDLSLYSGKKMKFRFKVTKGDFYSFWVSETENGESKGYVGGGGPGYNTSVDDQGKKAYEKASKFPNL